MKFLLVPDSFKESMSSIEACDAMEKGIKKVIKDATCIKLPMADGGEGTVEALVYSTNGTFYDTSVTSPLGNKVTAKFGILGNKTTAVIEMAEASGIHLVKREDRNPLIATTYGTGELIKKALDMNVEHIVIGLGGSATNDGGVGMLQALGVKFKDENEQEIAFGGGALNKIRSIDISGLDERIKDVTIEVACDVTNPLIGKEGASEIFGPQKGATKEMIKTLDKNLTHYADMIKRDLGKDVAYVEGAGAAGGLGAALMAFLNGKLVKGIDLVIKHTKLREKLDGIDYVFTGEGSIDNQTIYGKTPVGVSRVAKEKDIPVIAFAGRVGEVDKLYNEGINSVVGILSSVTSIDDALKLGKINLEKSSENITRMIATIRNKK